MAGSRTRRTQRAALVAALGLLALSCGDADTTTVERDVAAAEGDGDAADPVLGPVYALHVILFDPDFNATSYVLLTDTLDPGAFAIRGVKAASNLPLARDDGFEIEPGLNRQPRLRRGPVLRPFYYADKSEWLDYAPNSQIAVYDPVTHEERSIIDAPCPGLHVQSQDEIGNTYFSLWDAIPKLALYGQGPAPCVARVTPEGTLDEA